MSSVSSRPGSTKPTLTTQMVAPRPNSSLFAPTVSSLARQHASVKPPVVAAVPAPAPPPAVVSNRPVTIVRPEPPTPVASLYPSLPQGRRLVPKKSLQSLASSSAPPSPASCFPSLAAVQPLFPSLSGTVNLPTPTLQVPPQDDAKPASSSPAATPAKPKPYRPGQFKARVASKLASSQSSSTPAFRTPGGKKRSSVSASMHASSRPGAPTPKKFGALAAKEARKSVPTAGFGAGAARRETIVGGKEKGRGRRSEGGVVGLGRGRVVAGTPAKMRRVREE